MMEPPSATGNPPSPAPDPGGRRREVVAMRVAGGWVAAASDPGPVRASNEDSFLVDPELGLALVADGMGGHENGQYASRTVVASIRDHLVKLMAQLRDQESDPEPEIANQLDELLGGNDPDRTARNAASPAMSALFSAIESANHRLYAENVQRHFEEAAGMGTTVTGLWQVSEAGPYVSFHVGDSRLYRYRGGVLTQLTRDHTHYQAALDMGVAKEDLPGKNVLMQAVGPCPAVLPDVFNQVTAPGDVFLLCSDGMHGALPESVIEATLKDCRAEHLASDCEELIDAAIEYGSTDNITVMIFLRA